MIHRIYLKFLSCCSFALFNSQGTPSIFYYKQDKNISAYFSLLLYMAHRQLDGGVVWGGGVGGVGTTRVDLFFLLKIVLCCYDGISVLNLIMLTLNNFFWPAFCTNTHTHPHLTSCYYNHIPL